MARSQPSSTHPVGNIDHEKPAARHRQCFQCSELRDQRNHHPRISAVIGMGTDGEGSVSRARLPFCRRAGAAFVAYTRGHGVPPRDVRNQVTTSTTTTTPAKTVRIRRAGLKPTIGPQQEEQDHNLHQNHRRHLDGPPLGPWSILYTAQYSGQTISV